jgi:DNA-binding MarR family transcriptional regulator
MDDGVAAWSRLLRVHAALVPVLDQELQAMHQLPLSWYDVLLELNAVPGRRLTMTELGDRVVVSRTRVSRIVDALVDAGLVGRESHPEDRRSAYAVLTPEGRRRLRAAAPTYLAGIDRHFSARLTATDRRAVAHALNKVLAVEEGN